MIPLRGRSRFTAAALQQDGQCGMEHGEDEIERERGVEEVVGQVLGGPQREQAEHGEAGDGPCGSRAGVNPGERSDTEVHEEHVAEQQHRARGKGREGEEEGRERERDGGESEVAASEPPVGLGAAFGPPVGGEPERIEAEQHGEGDEDFVPFEIFLAGEKLVRPANIHNGCAERSERGKEMPAAVER